LPYLFSLSLESFSVVLFVDWPAISENEKI